MKYTLTCKKCDLNLINFNKKNKCYYCNCKPIKNMYLKCSGIYSEFLADRFIIQFCNKDNEDIYYTYYYNNEIIIFDEPSSKINYYININLNKLDCIEELYIVGNKLKQNLLFC